MGAFLDLGAVVVGLVLLVVGGEALVRGASGLALLARITPAVVGLTVVAAGTSAPELVVSVQSAIEGRPGLALGNIVGSNIFNAAFILGVVAVLQPIVVAGSVVRLEWPVMMLAALQLHLLARDGGLDRFEGACLAAALVAFTGYAIWIGRKVVPDESAELGPMETASFGRTGAAGFGLNLAAVAAGVGTLAIGSTFLVHGASAVAAEMGVSETVIGLTIVAAGTSTPELFASIVAARRGRQDMAVANVLGSNIFNVLGIGGLAAVIHPLPVPVELVDRDNWWMLGVSLLLLPLLRSGYRVSRVEGGLLVGVFVAYLAVLLHGVES